jgi:hypothetical protein
MKLLKLLLMLSLFSLCAYAQSGTVILGGASVASNPAYSCSPTTVAFGNQVINVPSVQQSSTCTNTGNALLSITSESTPSDTHFTFGTSNTCTAGTNLVPGGTCVVALVFTPTAVTAYSSSTVVTITGATGSPQTISLTGTGVSSGGGPPSGYTAPTSTTALIGYTGFTPLSSSNLPAEGGTVAADTNFVHTSAGGISGGTGTAFIQCAGSAAATTAHGINSGFATNASWRVDAGGQANIISIDDKWLSLGSSSSFTGMFAVDFTGAHTCTLEQLLGPGSSIQVNSSSTLKASKTGGSDADVFYGYPSPGPGFATLNMSAGAPGTVTNLIANLNSLSPAPCGVTLSGTSGGGVTTSPDNVSLGHDNVIGSVFGTSTENQDSWECVLFLQRTTGAVGWWDVKTDSCGTVPGPGSTPWSGGWPTISSGCTGIATTGGLHALDGIDASGNYAVVEIPAAATGPVVIHFGSSLTAINSTTLAGQGHFAITGPNLCAFSSGANIRSGVITCVPLSNPTATAFVVPRLGTAQGYYAADQHNSGNVVNAAGTSGLVYSMTYCPSATVCAGASQPTGIGQQELLMITPPPPSLTGTWTVTNYRFFHSMMNVPACTGSTAFWCYTTGNVSLDGTLAVIPTNWGATLGNDNGGTGSPRTVILMVEIR